MGYPVVHFEINTAAGPELARFYAEAFDWVTQRDGDDYIQITTEGVCAGTGAPGIDGGIGPSDPGDDFVTFYVQVPDVEATLAQVIELGAEVDMAPTEGGRVVFAIFRDPAGNRIGLVRAAPLPPTD
jgi:predicted enzyme related to lactoylglutathione lyase